MDDIVELVLQAWLWLLVLLPIGPVRGPRDARPDTPREKRMQYIVRPLVWMTLAGGAATGCAIGVGWVRLVCAPALGLFNTSLSWLAMGWFSGGAALAVVRRPRRSAGGADRLCGRLGAAQRCRHRPERGGAHRRRSGPRPVGEVGRGGRIAPRLTRGRGCGIIKRQEGMTPFAGLLPSKNRGEPPACSARWRLRFYLSCL